MTLSKEKIDFFKDILNKMKCEIGSVLDHMMSNSRTESTGYGLCMGQDLEDCDQGKSLELSNQDWKILKQIDRALEKIADGTYGICDISGEDIPQARLEAIPYTVYTTAVQEKIEKGLIK